MEITIAPDESKGSFADRSGFGDPESDGQGVSQPTTLAHALELALPQSGPVEIRALPGRYFKEKLELSSHTKLSAAHSELPTIFDAGWTGANGISNVQNVQVEGLAFCNGVSGLGFDGCEDISVNNCVVWNDLPPTEVSDLVPNMHTFGIARSSNVKIKNVGVFGWGRKSVQFWRSQGIHAEKMAIRWDGYYPYAEGDGNRGALFPAYRSHDVHLKDIFCEVGGSFDLRMIPHDYDAGGNLVGADAGADNALPSTMRNVLCYVHDESQIVPAAIFRLTTTNNFHISNINIVNRSARFNNHNVRLGLDARRLGVNAGTYDINTVGKQHPFKAVDWIGNHRVNEDVSIPDLEDIWPFIEMYSELSVWSSWTAPNPLDFWFSEDDE